MPSDRKKRWNELTSLLDSPGVKSLPVRDIKRLCRLYRQVTIDLSRARTEGEDPKVVHFLNSLAARAHGRVYAARPVDIRPAFTFFLGGFPRLVRSQAKPILAATGLFLLSALFSFLAVVRDPELAYSLFDEHVVEFENIRLEKQEGEYRGNFTFPPSASPLVAVQIIGNNIRVAVIMFATGAVGCLPGVMLLIFNGRMLGTLTGLVWNHGYVLDFYALVLTHGVLELSAICISGGAGMILGWAVIAPGRYSRREALRRAAVDAFGLLAGAAGMLVVAGMIEAYVTPHFIQPVRWVVAATSACLLLAYLGWAGRGSVWSRDRERAGGVVALLPHGRGSTGKDAPVTTGRGT